MPFLQWFFTQFTVVTLDLTPALIGEVIPGENLLESALIVGRPTTSKLPSPTMCSYM